MFGMTWKHILGVTVIAVLAVILIVPLVLKGIAKLKAPAAPPAA